jgi:putative NIF3 family GTP cyclohydrolase 1 type 2
MRAEEIAAFLDEHLRARDFASNPDGARLEVAGERPVKAIAYAVDLCNAVLREAAGRGGDMLVVRNGLGLERPLVGSHRQKVALCLQSGLSVYAAGTPLDAHAETGPSAQLLKELGMIPTRAFSRSPKTPVGLAATCDLSREELVTKLERICGKVRVLPAGPTRVRQVGVVAGRCEGFALDASAARFDTVITGETSHAGAVDAEDHGLNVILAGYQSTEALGIRALGEVVTARFEIPGFFVAHATGI